MERSAQGKAKESKGEKEEQRKNPCVRNHDCLEFCHVYTLHQEMGWVSLISVRGLLNTWFRIQRNSAETDGWFLDPVGNTMKLQISKAADHSRKSGEGEIAWDPHETKYPPTLVMFKKKGAFIELGLNHADGALSIRQSFGIEKEPDDWFWYDLTNSVENQSPDTLEAIVKLLNI